jgi:5-methylthioadenosine/S-adenosylhomocysteine deaminase
MVYRSIRRSPVVMIFALVLCNYAQTLSSAAAGPTVEALAAAARILIRNAALVLTMEPQVGIGPLGILETADVLFAGETIVAVGTGLQDADAVILDATGKIVLPGFVDVHNHLWQSLIRGCGTDKDLLDWLKECVFPMRGVGITEQEAYAAVRLSTLDLIATGVTTVVDDSHSFTPAFVAGNVRALQDSGLRFVYAYCGSTERFNDMRRVKTALIDSHPRATFQVCSHPGMGLLDWLTATSRLAQELHVTLNLHVNENIKQRQDEAFKAMQLAGAFDAKLLVNHAIHLTDEEIAQLAAHDVRVAHNPLSNMRLASGIIRLPEMRAAGIKVGLGLDGGTNDTSDAFANMRAAIGLQRVKSLAPHTFPTVIDVLRMGSLGGAEVLDMEHNIGSLIPGKKADLIILDPSHINFAPRWDWLSQIVFNGQPSNVAYVFVDGKPLKVAGRVVGGEQAEIVQAVEATAQRIKKALQAQK